MTHTAPAESSGIIPLSPPVNLRDLGGIEIGAERVRTGFAVRADDLSVITEDDADELVERGLRAVIDLRSADEVAVTGRGPLSARRTVNYHHVPFMADIGEASSATSTSGPDLADQSTFGQMYLRMYDQAAPQIVSALAIIAHAPGAVAFHCAAGQDRTGVLAAALLLSLGADVETIVTDYSRTGENSAAIRTRIAPIMAPLMSKFGLSLDAAAKAATRVSFSDAPMREMLQELASRHGDPLSPLREAGLDAPLVARLRARGLEGARD
ncbi:tyrosine-protein phosphatase [Cellulosimicrobium funkei]|nr:tyrosine-protein phosphatase [Cellulosimicrobium funkei]